MLRHGYEPGMGLGRNRNGIASLVEFMGNCGRFGWGYEPTCANKRRITLERRGRSLAHPQGLQVERIPFATSMKASSVQGGCARDRLP